MTLQLDRKTALVFGAGYNGEGWSNGKAAAVAYARAGAVVACVDIDLQAAQATAKVITSEGNRAIALQADVTDLASVETATAAAIAQMGVVDILHNNVGVTHMGGRWSRTSAPINCRWN